MIHYSSRRNSDYNSPSMVIMRGIVIARLKRACLLDSALMATCMSTDVRMYCSKTTSDRYAALITLCCLGGSYNYIGHNYIDHNYIGHNYIGHNYRP